MRKNIIIITILLCGILITSRHAQATAGGHGGGTISGGHSSGSGGHSVSSKNNSYFSTGVYSGGNGSGFGIIIIGGSMFFWRKYKENKEYSNEYSEFMSTLPGTDKQKQVFLSEIEEIFLRIQAAWNVADLNSVADLYTEKLLKNHLEVLDDNKIRGIHNHIKGVQVEKFSNYRSINGHSFSIQITFSAIDFEEHSETGCLISGNKRVKQQFTQIWYFEESEQKGKWQLDYIQVVSLS